MMRLKKMATKDHNVGKKNQALQSPEVGALKIAAAENVPAGADAIRR
jgi:hypothetical protein